MQMGVVVVVVGGGDVLILINKWGWLAIGDKGEHLFCIWKSLHKLDNCYIKANYLPLCTCVESMVWRNVSYE
jgi:hypothetical protein